MTYYSALHYAAKAEKSASTAVEAAEIAKQLGNDRINQTHITNCITEIPQDIKLELVDGALTLKAGSKVYVPNGFEADGVTPKFDVVVIESDITISGAGTGVVNNFLFYRNSTTLDYKQILNCNSGTSDSQSNGTAYYDTTQNKLHCYTANGAKTQDSFPLCSFTLSNGTVTSIDQVFNGFGYIGSTVFALPGVKGLIPNGRNADGSLKSIEFVLDGVKTNTNTTNNDAQWIFYDGNNLQDRSINNTRYYDENENKWYISNGYYSYCHLATVKRTIGAVTSFNPKLPFHAVDYNDAALKQNFQVVSTLPSSQQADVFYCIPE